MWSLSPTPVSSRAGRVSDAARLVVLCAGLWLLATGCDLVRHEPDGTRFREVTPPQTPIVVTLSADGDTLLVRGATQINYDVDLGGRRFARAEFFVDGVPVVPDETRAGRIDLDTRTLRDGRLPFELVVLAFSASGSLASQLGAEVLVDTLRGTLLVDNAPPEPVALTSAQVRDDVLEVRWTRYPPTRAGFQRYLLSRRYGDGPTERLALLDDVTTTSFRDAEYTGGPVEYAVSVQVASADDERDAVESVPSPTRAVNLPIPRLRNATVTEDGQALSWSATPTPGAFSTYELYRMDPSDLEWSRVKLTADPNDTTYAVAWSRFGSGQQYELRTTPLTWTPPGVPPRVNVAWPDRLVDASLSGGLLDEPWTVTYLPTLDAYLALRLTDGNRTYVLRRYDAATRQLEAEATFGSGDGLAGWTVEPDGSRAYRVDATSLLAVDLSTLRVDRTYDVASLFPSIPFTAFSLDSATWVVNGRLFANLKVNTVTTSDVFVVADLDPLRRIALFDRHHPTDTGTALLRSVSPSGDFVTVETYDDASGRAVGTYAVETDTLRRTAAIASPTGNVPLALLPDDVPGGPGVFAHLDGSTLKIRRLSDHDVVRRIEVGANAHEVQFDAASDHFAVFRSGADADVLIVDPQGTRLGSIPLLSGVRYTFQNGTLWDVATAYLDVFGPLPF